MSALYSLALLAAIPAMVVAFLVWFDRQSRRNEPDTEADLAHFADMRALPEPAWADPTPLEARRLRSVPMQPSLSIVPPPADDSWLEDLITSRPSPFTVPAQRQAGEQS